ncbi:hypothetical protein E4V51_30955, partial [Paenibacillus sp. 28ISP30-2]|nr:hypothetical protein [Paenibacillus sp. 28ISP30-2]
MLDIETPLGQQIKRFFELLTVKQRYFSNELNEQQHLEFEPELDINSEEQIDGRSNRRNPGHVSEFGWSFCVGKKKIKVNTEVTHMSHVLKT